MFKQNVQIFLWPSVGLTISSYFFILFPFFVVFYLKLFCWCVILWKNKLKGVYLCFFVFSISNIHFVSIYFFIFSLFDNFLHNNVRCHMLLYNYPCRIKTPIRKFIKNLINENRWMIKIISNRHLISPASPKKYLKRLQRVAKKGSQLTYEFFRLRWVLNDPYHIMLVSNIILTSNWDNYNQIRFYLPFLGFWDWF